MLKKRLYSLGPRVVGSVSVAVLLHGSELFTVVRHYLR